MLSSVAGSRGRLAGLLVVAWTLVGCDLGAPRTVHTAPGNVVGSGDIDGDGDVDLVTSGNDDELGVLLGDGAGGFSVTTIPNVTQCDVMGEPTTCTNVRVTDVVDVDDDGFADVAYSYDFQSNLPPPGDQAHTVHAMRLADGTGAFGTELGRPAGELTDVTGDGLADGITVSDPFSDPLPVTITVRAGNGAGAFGPAVVSTVPGDHPLVGLKVADLDEDGHADLVLDQTCLGGSGEANLRACIDVMLGDGTGAFTLSSRLTVPNTTVDGVSVDIGDLDGDGDLDLAGGNRGADFDGTGRVGSLSLFYGDGAGGFGPEVVRPAITETVDVELADLDVDGHLDLLTQTDDGDADSTDDLHWIRFGDETGELADSHPLSKGFSDLIVDLDADGKPDWVVNTGNDEISIFMNRWNGRPDD